MTYHDKRHRFVVGPSYGTHVLYINTCETFSVSSLNEMKKNNKKTMKQWKLKRPLSGRGRITKNLALFWLRVMTLSNQFSEVSQSCLSEINAPVGCQEEVYHTHKWWNIGEKGANIPYLGNRGYKTLYPTCTQLLSEGGNPSIITSLPGTQCVHSFLITRGETCLDDFSTEFGNFLIIMCSPHPSYSPVIIFKGPTTNCNIFCLLTMHFSRV